MSRLVSPTLPVIDALCRRRFGLDQASKPTFFLPFLSFALAGLRIIITALPPKETHLEIKMMADLFLDTFPYGAHSTAIDALWSGIPLVTRAGDTLASRVGARSVPTVKLSLALPPPPTLLPPPPSCTKRP